MGRGYFEGGKHAHLLPNSNLRRRRKRADLVFKSGGTYRRDALDVTHKALVTKARNELPSARLAAPAGVAVAENDATFRTFRQREIRL